MKLQVAEGDNLLDIAQANDLEMEGMSSRVSEPFIHVVQMTD